MEDDEMTDLLANSLEGNALGVKDAVNAMMNARALDALQSMKVDVAKSIYGTYASDDEGGEEAEAEIEDMEIPQDDDEFIVTGDLTIHGVTKSVDVKFELLGTSQDPWGGTRIGFEGKAEISRKEFGLVWNVALETGGVLVSDTIKLEMDVEAVKK